MELDKQWMNLAEQVELEIIDARKNIEQIVEWNQLKVMRAMQKYQLSDFHFNHSTGYGYNDRGREIIDLIYAEVFRTESALVRPHIVSGTHAISVSLFGILRPGDELLFITGQPYDTLHKVIGLSDSDDSKLSGSLTDWGVLTNIVPLAEDQRPNWELIRASIRPQTKVIAIQRSRGYEWRNSFCIDEISEMVSKIKAIRKDLIVFVDNCYGEFTERFEPSEVGVDLLAGSLIKNPGGGIASSGGYIAGRKDLVSRVANQLTAPGIGADVGAMLGTSKEILQGFFLSPHVVGQAMQGSIFAANLFARLGLETKPSWQDKRTDLIQAVRFPDADQLLRFVQSIQQNSPVDSHVTPVPWDMPGYEHPVVMAAGTFVQGGSLELSCDAPIREPYIAYMQGGLTYAHVKWSVLFTASKLFVLTNDK